MSLSSVRSFWGMEEEWYEFPFPYRQIKAALTLMMRRASSIMLSLEFVFSLGVSDL